MTLRDFIDRLGEALVPIVGPIIADLVIRVAIRQVALELNPEERAQLESNRQRAIAARADEARRSLE